MRQRYLRQIRPAGWILGWTLCTGLSITALAENTYVVAVRDEAHHLLRISGEEVLGATEIGFGYNYGFNRDRIAILGVDSRPGCELGCSLLTLFDAASGRETLALPFAASPARYLSGPRNQILFAEGRDLVYFLTLSEDPARPMDLNAVDLGSGERLVHQLPRGVGYPVLSPLRHELGLFDRARSALFAFDGESGELGIALLERGGGGREARAREVSLLGEGIFLLRDNLLVDVSEQRFEEIAGEGPAAGKVRSSSYRESGGVGALAAADETSRLLTSVLVFTIAGREMIAHLEIPFATRSAALSADGRYLIFLDQEQGRLVFYDSRLGALSYGADLRGRSEGTLTVITRYD